MGLFVQRLEGNLKKMNEVFDEINALFDAASIDDFKKLPDDRTECGEFAKLFREFNTFLEAAKIQGFKWGQSTYEFAEGSDKTKVDLCFTEVNYLILLVRYKELATASGSSGGTENIPYEIDGHLTEIDTGVIDANFMNSRFDKYLKTLQGGDADAIQKTLAELHRSFARLTQEEQKFADIFLHDIQRGDVVIDSVRPFKDYVIEYQSNAKNREIDAVAHRFGLDKSKLYDLMNTAVTDANIDEYGRFHELKSTVDRQKAKTYFEAVLRENMAPYKVNMKTDELLRKFIVEGGFEIENFENSESISSDSYSS